jgi:hypothetical protein
VKWLNCHFVRSLVAQWFGDSRPHILPFFHHFVLDEGAQFWIRSLSLISLVQNIIDMAGIQRVLVTVTIVHNDLLVPDPRALSRCRKIPALLMV